MRPTLLALGLLGLAIGCRKDALEEVGAKAKDTVDAAKSAAADAILDAKARATDVAGAAQDRLDEQRAEARRQLEARLIAVESEITRLRRKIDRLEGKARQNVKDQLDALEHKRAAALRELREASDKTGEAWQMAKRGLERAASDLEDACHDVQDKLE